MTSYNQFFAVTWNFYPSFTALYILSQSIFVDIHMLALPLDYTLFMYNLHSSLSHILPVLNNHRLCIKSSFNPTQPHQLLQSLSNPTHLLAPVYSLIVTSGKDELLHLLSKTHRASFLFLMPVMPHCFSFHLHFCVMD